MTCQECKRLEAELSNLRGGVLEELAALKKLNTQYNADRIFYIKQCKELIDEVHALRVKR